MSNNLDNTVSFSLVKDGEEKVRAVLQMVYRSLEEKGYNPINQLIGYMISGDPAYITSHNNARSIIGKIDRDEILENLLRSFLQQNS